MSSERPAVALLTPPGRAALAVVGVVGSSAAEVLARWFRPMGRTALADRPDGAIVFGRWGRVDAVFATVIPPEDLVVVKRSSRSFEVHPHGGLAAAERVLCDLVAVGCRRLAWAEWLAADGLREIEVEVRVALAAATGPKASAILARQSGSSAGGREHSAERKLSYRPPGLLESAIDAIGDLAGRGDSPGARGRAEKLLEWAPLGLRLTRPWRVVVSGEPNAGKSSLVNALAGFTRSLVSPKPGTTRDVLEARVVLDGWEIDLVDTAGLRESPPTVTERIGIARARDAVHAADLVLAVFDGLTASSPGNGMSHRRVGGNGMPDDGRVIRVLSKLDLVTAVGRAERSDDAIHTSAVTGAGIAALAAAIVHRLVPREPGPQDAVPFTSRQVELIRRLATTTRERGTAD